MALVTGPFLGRIASSSKGKNAFIYISKMTISSKGDNSFIYISMMTMSSVISCFQKATMPSFTFRRRQFLQTFHAAWTSTSGQLDGEIPQTKLVSLSLLPFYFQ